MRQEKLVMRQMVKFHDIVRVSNPLWPRVMGDLSRGRSLSVDRGKHRLSIELRKQNLEVPTLLGEGEGDTMDCAMRVVHRLLGVIRPDACVDAYDRNLGGPGGDPSYQRVRSGEELSSKS